MSEIWQVICGFPDYEISNMGRVRCWKSIGRYSKRLKTPRLLKLTFKKYYQVGLCCNGLQKTKRVHTLVLETFVGPRPKGMEACHLDDDKSNNKLENLRWDTHINNCVDRDRNGKHYKGEDSIKSKLTNDQVININILLQFKASPGCIAEWFEVCEKTIYNIKNKKSWKHMTNENN